MKRLLRHGKASPRRDFSPLHCWRNGHARTSKENPSVRRQVSDTKCQMPSIRCRCSSDAALVKRPLRNTRTPHNVECRRSRRLLANSPRILDRMAGAEVATGETPSVVWCSFRSRNHHCSEVISSGGDRGNDFLRWCWALGQLQFTHSGMFPCLRCGSCSRLVASISRLRVRTRRVSLGAMTSST